MISTGGVCATISTTGRRKILKKSTARQARASQLQLGAGGAGAESSVDPTRYNVCENAGLKHQTTNPCLQAQHGMAQHGTAQHGLLSHFPSQHSTLSSWPSDNFFIPIPPAGRMDVRISSMCVLLLQGHRNTVMHPNDKMIATTIEPACVSHAT